ncbi:MAG TPA: lipopolysaccharide biosynthesis protein [Longimicrobium sp.]
MRGAAKDGIVNGGTPAPGVAAVRGEAGSAGSPLRGSLARNALWMFTGQFARTIVQGAYFVCLARALGVSGYGAFIGATALVAILAPYVGWGAGNLLIQGTVRDASTFRAWWGYAISATVASGGALLLVVLAVSRVLLPDAIGVGQVIAVALADLVFTRLVDVSGQASLAFRRYERAAQLQVLPTFVRLIAAAVMLGNPALATQAAWALLYLAATATAAGVAVAAVSMDHGRPQLRGSLRVRQARNGFFFAVTLSAQGVCNDVDKTLLVRLGSLSSAGLYGAAYRVVDVSFVPVKSLLAAAYPRFFEHGASGIGASLAFARRLVPLAAAYSAAAALALYFGAPILPLVLGDDFAGAAQAVRWLAAIPLLRALHSFAADTLTGADRQGIRGAVQVAVALVNIALNLWLIPLYSWRGAAGASLAGDGLLVVGMWGAVWLVHARARRVETALAAAQAASGPAALLLEPHLRTPPPVTVHGRVL